MRVWRASFQTARFWLFRCENCFLLPQFELQLTFRLCTSSSACIGMFPQESRRSSQSSALVESRESREAQLAASLSLRAPGQFLIARSFRIRGVFGEQQFARTYLHASFDSADKLQASFCCLVIDLKEFKRRVFFSASLFWFWVLKQLSTAKLVTYFWHESKFNRNYSHKLRKAKSAFSLNTPNRKEIIKSRRDFLSFHSFALSSYLSEERVKRDSLQP